MTDEYYNTEEACMLLKLGRTTVYKLLKSGKLKSTKVGRSYRILGQDIKVLSIVLRKFLQTS